MGKQRSKHKFSLGAFDAVLKAREEILKHAEGKKLPVRGRMPCPVCSDGELVYAIASNGHVHGCCTTPSCVSWME